MVKRSGIASDRARVGEKGTRKSRSDGGESASYLETR